MYNCTHIFSIIPNNFYNSIFVFLFVVRSFHSFPFQTHHPWGVKFSQFGHVPKGCETNDWHHLGPHILRNENGTSWWVEPSHLKILYRQIGFHFPKLIRGEHKIYVWSFSTWRTWIHHHLRDHAKRPNLRRQGVTGSTRVFQRRKTQDLPLNESVGEIVLRWTSPT